MWDAFWQLSAVGALIMIALMALLWVLHFPLRNASIVDVGWALGLPLLAVTYAALGPGDAMRSWTMAAMTVVWGGRLGGYLAWRIIREGREEGRYRRLRAHWKTHAGAKYLAFFMCITNNDRASLSFPPEEMRHWRIDYCSWKMIE